MRIPRGIAIGAGSGALLGLLAFGCWSLRPDHLKLPRPRGLVARIELPEAMTPYGNASVRALPTQPPRLRVSWRVDDPLKSLAYLCAEYEYPSGRRLGAPVETWELQRPQALASFDFDGDGTPDELHCDLSAGTHRVEVRSGATGRGLFVHEDPREYEYEVGAFPLGDLDGDGCAELALQHPRMDRSDYDIEPFDAVLGARSWITVVSGRLACAR